MVFIKKFYKRPYEEKLEKLSESERSNNDTMAAKYWGAKNISLKDIALTVSIAFVIVAISDKLAFLIQGFFSEENALSKIIGGFLEISIFL